MLRSEPALALILALGVASLSAHAASLQIRQLRIESDPSGAEVHGIGGLLGTTPLSIPERAIYPNDFPDERLPWYGVVELRHPGCRPLRHRVTLKDVTQGLHLRLQCTDTGMPAPPARPESAPGAKQATRRTDPYRRRLRQLKVLQELLEDGLISAEEEANIRRRILEHVDE